ncbi:hypothetical protein CLOM_g1670, partial [Closterium sp. NIES-68]
MGNQVSIIDALVDAEFPPISDAGSNHVVRKPVGSITTSRSSSSISTLSSSSGSSIANGGADSSSSTASNGGAGTCTCSVTSSAESGGGSGGSGGGKGGSAVRSIACSDLSRPMGILAFEVAGLMHRVLDHWSQLEPGHVAELRQQLQSENLERLGVGDFSFRWRMA